MARIAGVDIPLNKKIKVALTYVKGIGRSSAVEILARAEVDKEKRTKDITDAELAKIRNALESMEIPVEGELNRIISQNIKRLKSIGCYRGIRHKKGLPVRGQRTRSNARTRKGKKKTVGGLKRKLVKK